MFNVTDRPAIGFQELSSKYQICIELMYIVDFVEMHADLEHV